MGGKATGQGGDEERDEERRVSSGEEREEKRRPSCLGVNPSVFSSSNNKMAFAAFADLSIDVPATVG